MPNRKPGTLLRSAVMAFFTAMAFFMSYPYCPAGAYDSPAADAVYQLLKAMTWGWHDDNGGLLLTLGFLGFFGFYRLCLPKLADCARVRFAGILAMVFALCHTAGIHYYYRYDLFSLRQSLKAVTMLAGFWLLYYVLIHWLYSFMGKDISRVYGVSPRWKARFLARPMAVSFAVLLCCWLPHVLIRYPAAFCADAVSQTLQALGLRELSSHHPVFHTMMIRLFLGIGDWLGSRNVGMLLYALTQTVFCALVYSYCVSVLVRLRAHKWSILVALGFFALNPYVFNYVGIVIKDSYFVAMSILFTVLLAEYTLDRRAFLGSWKRPLALVAAAVIMAVQRNNGIYVTVPTALVLMAVELVQRRGLWKRMLVLLVLVCLLPLGAAKLVDGVFQPVKGSIAEALSLPFQQTARFVRDHGDQVTDREREVIDRILPFDELAELYDPSVSDPVKLEFRQDATTKELAAYLGVWLRQFFRSPMCYVQATLEQNMYLAYPGYNNHSVYVSGYVELPDGSQLLHTPQWLQKLQRLYSDGMQAYYEGPVLNLIHNMAVYTMVFWVLVLFVLTKRDYRQLSFLLPVMLAFFVIILAPCIRWQDRYSFPVLYAVPLLFGFFTTRLPRENENG